MPFKMGLQISNGNYYSGVAATPSPSNTAVTPPPRKIGLNASMVQRIHTIRPGCGSCGR
jgi:hypothetical protein